MFKIVIKELLGLFI